MVQADELYDNTDPEWLRMRGYRNLNSAKTQFGPRENDFFTVEIDNIIGKLADPKLLPAIAYEFIGTADTKEMSHRPNFMWFILICVSELLMRSKCNICDYSNLCHFVLYLVEAVILGLRLKTNVQFVTPQ